MMRRLHNRGVTLIELLIAVALGFILIMLAVPAYNTWTSDAEVSSAASSIADGLRRASAEAIKRNTAVEFVLTPAVGWVARLPAPALTVLTQDRFAEGAKRASVVTSPPSTTTITFTSLGGMELVNADTTAPIDFVNVNVAGAVRTLRVLVGTTRNGVRICDPKFSFASDPKGC